MRTISIAICMLALLGWNTGHLFAFRTKRGYLLTELQILI